MAYNCPIGFDRRKVDMQSKMEIDLLATPKTISTKNNFR
jgi:hypothetical protein